MAVYMSTGYSVLRGRTCPGSKPNVSTHTLFYLTTTFTIHVSIASVKVEKFVEIS